MYKKLPKMIDNTTGVCDYTFDDAENALTAGVWQFSGKVNHNGRTLLGWLTV